MLEIPTGLSNEALFRVVTTDCADEDSPIREFSGISTPVATIRGLPVTAATVTV